MRMKPMRLHAVLRESFYLPPVLQYNTPITFISRLNALDYTKLRG